MRSYSVFLLLPSINAVVTCLRLITATSRQRNTVVNAYEAAVYESKRGAVLHNLFWSTHEAGQWVDALGSGAGFVSSMRN